MSFAPSVRIGGAVLVPAAAWHLETILPLASEAFPRIARFAAFSIGPMALPPSWEPWMTDGTAYVIVEEREYIDAWASIAETAIAEAPDQDVVSARIPNIDLFLHAPAARGGGSVAVPAISISLTAGIPQGIGRPRAPIIQIIAS